jgi:D-xylose transport system ATP-binding protein
MSTILDMVDIRKSFGAIKALDGVNFSLEKNEIHALVGENGAGKSTLMKVLSGSYPHGSYEGEIIIEGVKQFFKSPFDSKNAGIEMIYQEISMHPDLSVAENIFLGKIPSKWGFANHKKMIRESEKYLEMVGLNILPTMIMRNLSTSQQQMVSIARALSSNPKILILFKESK